MKVIFNKEFKADIQILNNNIEITEYIIVSQYTEILNISTLFNDSFINNDVAKTNISKLNSIWDKNKKLLSIDLTISDQDRNKLSENNYNFIYCYYKIPGVKNKIAFILTGDFIDESPYNFDIIDLNLYNNLINIQFPNYTVANIITNSGDDIKFLEGAGIYPGINIFFKQDNESLVAKNSYLTYLRYLFNSGVSNDLPYLNNRGEKILNLNKYSTVTDINIRTENSIQESGILVDKSLSPNGGSVKILGSFKYKEIILVDDLPITLVEEEKDITELSNFEFLIVNDKGLKFTFDEEKFIIYYEENLNPNEVPYSDIIIRYHSLNPATNTVTTTNSEVLRLSQGEAEPDWIIDSETPFNESNYRLYLFSNQKDEIQFFDVKTNIDLTEEDIIIENDNNLNEFFEVYSEVLDNNTLRVYIKTLQDNLDKEKWNPVVSGESLLSPYKLSIRSREEIFYCIQSPDVPGIESFEKEKDSFIFNKIENIEFNNKTVGIELYFTEEQGEINDKNYWKLISKDKNIDINPEKDKLNSNLIIEDTDNDLYKTLIYTDVKASGVNDINFNPLYLCRLSEEELDTLDITDWRQVVNLGKLYLPIKLLGEEPIIEIQEKELILDKYGVYKFYVKSNCKFRAYITAGDTSVGLNKIVFFDNTERNITSDDYSLSNGVPIYIRTWIADYLGNDNSLIELENIIVENIEGSIEKQETLRVYQRQLQPELEKLSPLEDIIFTENNGNVKYYSNKSVSVRSSNSELKLDNKIVLNRDTNELTRGYVYGETTYSSNEMNLSYPVKYLGELTVTSSGYYSGQDLKYKLYLKGKSPEISLIDFNNDNIFLNKSDNNYIDVKISSIYPINNEDIEIKNDFSDENYSFSYNISPITSTEGEYIYNIRIRANQENLTLNNKYLGLLRITSRIKKENFLIGEDNTFTQHEIDIIAGISIIELGVYQYGEVAGIPEIVGDSSHIMAGGEFRSYEIINVKDYLVSIVNDGISINTTYDSIYHRINAEFKNVLVDKKYSPIPLTDYKRYIKYSKDRKVGFYASMYDNITGDELYVDSVNLFQLGYKEGIVYQDLTYQPTLFLGTWESNAINREIEYNTTEFDLFLGLLNCTKKINNGDLSKSVNVKLISTNNSQLLINNNNQFNKGNFNIKLITPINNSKEDIIYTITAETLDSNRESHKLTINIIQKRKDYIVNSSNNNSVIRFHSSGHCIQNINVGLDILDNKLITNINQEDIIIKTEKDIGLIYEVTFLNQENIDSNRYKLEATINPNNTGEVISSKIYIGYVVENNFISLWEGILKQGFFEVFLTTPEETIIYPGNDVGSLENPISIGSRNSLSPVVRFPITIKRREILENGELEEDKNKDPKYCSINQTPGYSPIWVSLNNEISEIFSEYESIYNNTIGYIEHTFTVSSNYSNKEAIINISLNLILEFEDIKEYSDNLSYSFYLRKEKGEEGFINITPGEIDPISNEGGTIELKIDTNINEINYSCDVDWINISKLDNIITLTIGEYLERENRIGKITITGEDIEKSLNITQLGIPYLEVTQKEFTVDKNENNIEIPINSNVEFDSNTDDSNNWITNKVIEKDKIKYTILKNNTINERTGIIKVNAKDSELNIEESDVTVTQEKGDIILEITPEELTVDKLGGNAEFTVNTNTEFIEEIGVDWVIKDEELSTLNKLIFKVSENQNEKRETSITIKDISETVSKTVKIIQSGIEE